MGRRDDVVAGLSKSGDGNQLRGLATVEQSMNMLACRRGITITIPGSSNRADSAFESGHALLEHVGRGVHDARVDVAWGAQGEEVGGVLAVVEDLCASEDAWLSRTASADIARGCVDGHRAGFGRRVGGVSCVQGERLEAVGSGHGERGVESWKVGAPHLANFHTLCEFKTADKLPEPTRFASIHSINESSRCSSASIYHCERYSRFWQCR